MANRIEVDTSSQTLRALDGGKIVYKFDCVSGDEDHPTDKGTFRIFLKDKNHVSHKYHVKMFYAMFFTHDGKAIHQYHGPAPLWLVRSLKQDTSDWFGSHGCVRLAEGDARTLFDWAPMRTTVHIT
jgi:lipoprotein-anchoring transpeptidase ErfK/SrfK